MKRKRDDQYGTQSGDPEGELDAPGHDGGEDEADGVGDPNRSLTFDARTRHAFLAEDDDRLDASDDNLSDLFASMGVEERLDELGL